jgi:dTDP-4-amino-4,6-dideoxygalactose transaminase
MPDDNQPPFLDYFRCWLDDDDANAVLDVLRSGWITTGPKAQQFERAVADRVGAAHAVAVNSGTAAMHVALAALGIGPGDEVITTPFTFCATAEVIEYQGACPVLADIDLDTFNIHPALIEDKITSHTRALLPVHYAGHPCEMDPIIEIARRRRLHVVEDAAHAIGSAYRGRPIGALGDVTAFSFYPTKNITTGEGGMATTNDEDLAARMRRLSLHGMSRDAWKRYTAAGSWYYEVTDLGYKYNMPDLLAALGLSQLAKLDRFNELRAQHAAAYHEGLHDLPELILPHPQPHVRANWHLYVVLLRPELLTLDRAAFIEALRAAGIGTSVHFIPLHLHPHYQKRFGWKPGLCPNAEWVYERAISLPLYPKMTPADVARVIEAVRDVVARHRK